MEEHFPREFRQAAAIKAAATTKTALNLIIILSS